MHIQLYNAQCSLDRLIVRNNNLSNPNYFSQVRSSKEVHVVVPFFISFLFILVESGKPLTLQKLRPVLEPIMER